MIVLDLDQALNRSIQCLTEKKGASYLLDTSYILQQSFSEDEIIYRSREDELCYRFKTLSGKYQSEYPSV